jgi:glyoxylase-like metal-dependent hydrolase (beta-lactamase superfamily II)
MSTTTTSAAGWSWPGAPERRVLAAADDLGFDHRAVTDGAVVEAGRMRLRVLHTPGR